MKKLTTIASVLLLLCVASRTMSAPGSADVVLNLQDGSQKSIALSSIGKINFANSNLVFNFATGTVDNYPLTNVRSLVFNGLSSGIEKTAAARPVAVYPSLADRVVSLSNLSDIETPVTIFRQDGVAVISTTVSSSAQQINVSQLARGFYFISVNNQVLKFVKR